MTEPTRTLALTHRIGEHETTHRLVLDLEVVGVRVQLCADVDGERHTITRRCYLAGQRDAHVVHDPHPAPDDAQVAFTLAATELAWHDSKVWEPADPAKLTQEPVR